MTHGVLYTNPLRTVLRTLALKHTTGNSQTDGHNNDQLYLDTNM